LTLWSRKSYKNSLFDRGSIGEMGLCVRKNKSQYMGVLGYPTVQALLARGADVNAKDNKGQIALMRANKGHKEIVQLLKKAGAKE
jgi:ankyrin repeat protein